MAESLLFGQVFFSCLGYLGFFPAVKEEKFIVKKRYLICSRIVMVLIFLSQYFYFDVLSSYPNFSIFTYIGLISSSYGFCASVFVCVLSIHYRRNEICDIVNEIQDCWENWKRSPSIIKKNIWFILIYRGNVIIIQIGIVAFTTHRLFVSPNPHYGSTYFLIDVMMTQIFATCDNVFLVLTLNGYFLFSWLNESFGNWCEMCLKSNRSLDEKSAKAFRVYFYDRYLKILGVLNNLNRSFSVINFVVFAYCSCSTIVMSVLFMIGLFNKGKQTVYLTDFLLFVYFFVNKTLVCLYVVSLVKKEMDHALFLIHRVSVRNDNEKVKEELEILYLLLIHRSFSFDACGWFKIDYSLLLSMMGTTVTYILILIQSEYGSGWSVTPAPAFVEK